MKEAYVVKIEMLGMTIVMASSEENAKKWARSRALSYGVRVQEVFADCDGEETKWVQGMGGAIHETN